jgi:hypothetical protein
MEVYEMVYLDDSQAERGQLIEKLEDCLDLIAAVQVINEVNETGDVSDWDEFEKELDAMEE